MPGTNFNSIAIPPLYCYCTVSPACTVPFCANGASLRYPISVTMNRSINPSLPRRFQRYPDNSFCGCHWQWRPLIEDLHGPISSNILKGAGPLQHGHYDGIFGQLYLSSFNQPCLMAAFLVPCQLITLLTYSHILLAENSLGALLPHFNASLMSYIYNLGTYVILTTWASDPLEDGCR